eukprot:TRINITY_DN17127_c0_g1_i1.p1 TRINITY_DN17127_c0_g1~~TRINITY_DN17127_c0_g1_i1.p1  ORF type:complete len:168 (-),score=34.15 TRINITY_DN17127_c0_g1_i1:378-881(-)
MSQDGEPSQGGAMTASREGGSEWSEKYPDIYSSEPPTDDSQEQSNISLEGTVQVVKENMWYIGDAALKSVAEVLYGFGISPTVLGYSEEELLEEDEDEYDMAAPAVQRDEVVAKTSFAMRSEENMQRRKSEEPPPPPPEEDAYLEQGNDGWGGEEDFGDFGEDKKDK